MAIGNNKVYKYCFFILCGGAVLDFINWLVWEKAGGMDFIFHVIIAVLFVSAVLTIIIRAFIRADGRSEFSVKYHLLISLLFSAVMGISSFICRIIISMLTGSAFTDPKGFWGAFGLIGILVSIILAFSFIVCILTFYFTFAFRNAKN